MFHDAEIVSKMVIAPEEMRPFDGWECAVAWQSGGGLECPVFVMLCRRSTPESVNSEPEPWAWRYVVSSIDETATVFDTIPDFLAMYCQSRKHPIPNASELDDAHVLSGMWFRYGFIWHIGHNIQMAEQADLCTRLASQKHTLGKN